MIDLGQRFGHVFVFEIRFLGFIERGEEELACLIRARDRIVDVNLNDILGNEFGFRSVIANRFNLVECFMQSAMVI